jgi:hypothetical protein
MPDEVISFGGHTLRISENVPQFTLENGGVYFRSLSDGRILLDFFVAFPDGDGEGVAKFIVTQGSLKSLAESIGDAYRRVGSGG